MPDLASQLRPTSQTVQEPKPDFFDLSQEKDQTRLSQLLENNPHITIIDRYEQQLKEIFVLEHPWLNIDRSKLEPEFALYREKHYGQKEPWTVGLWAYLPWRNVLLHLLPDAEFQHVRTARNRNLIPADEQEKYYNSTIGIAGLSVGNSVALSLVLMGGGKRLRLADNDTLELTNLNRIRGSIADLTKPKVYMTAQQIYELDPYADLALYTDGLTEENIQQFFDGPPRLDVVIDEIDNLGMKLRMREEAQKRGIPVVMATDNGDSGMVDVERYDLDSTIKPFHGRVPEEILARIRSGEKLPPPVVGATIGEHLVGWDIVEPRMQRSMLEIGKTIPTWPQLGGAAVLNGVAVAVAVRKILTGQPVTDRRAIISLTSDLIPEYESPASIAERKNATDTFLQELRDLFAKMQRGQ